VPYRCQETGLRTHGDPGSKANLGGLFQGEPPGGVVFETVPGALMGSGFVRWLERRPGRGPGGQGRVKPHDLPVEGIKPLLRQMQVFLVQDGTAILVGRVVGCRVLGDLDALLLPNHRPLPAGLLIGSAEILVLGHPSTDRLRRNAVVASGVLHEPAQGHQLADFLGEFGRKLRRSMCRSSRFGSAFRIWTGGAGHARILRQQAG
jgi:hypothetical protein